MHDSVDSMSDELLTGDHIATLGLADWRPLLGAVEARFTPSNFVEGLEFVQAVGEAAERANHHPDITLTYGSVHIYLTSHDTGGKTQRDVDLATEISALAAARGIAADPAGIHRYELALDVADIPAAQAFWAAAFGAEANDTDEVVDPNGVLPALWLQQTTPHDEPGQRFHIDLWVPPEQVEPRIAACEAAGGTLVSDEQAPRFWIVADPEGNKVCFCTHQTRSH